MRLRRPVLLLLSLAAVCACAGESRSVDSRQVVLEAGIGQSKADISETGIFLWSKGDSFTAFLTDGSPVRFSLEGSGGRSMASFSATLGSGDVLAGLAVYPEGDHRSGEDALTFNLPARSSVTGGGNRAPMGATFEEGAAQISFRQVAGLLRFVVRDVPVEASQFCVTAPGRRIVGDFPLKLSVADSLCTEESPSGNTVTLIFPRLKAPGTLTFSVPLPCGDYPSLEFGLRDAGGRVLTSAVSGGLHLMRAEVIDVAAMSAADRVIGDYSVVFPAKASSFMKQGAENFASAIAAVTGSRPAVKDDSTPPAGPEILLGNTSREASATFLASLPASSCGLAFYGEDNDSVTLGGADEGLTCYALYQFESRVLSRLSKEGRHTLGPGDAFVSTLGHRLCIRDLVPFGPGRIRVTPVLVGRTISVSGYRGSQGGCSDGTFFYVGFTDCAANGTPNSGVNCVIVKSLLSDVSHVATSAPYVGNHVNSLTYCADDGYIYSLTNNFDDIVRLDAKTLKEVDRVQFTDETGAVKHITAISYAPLRKNFILRSGVNMYVTDVHLNPLLHGYRADSDFVRQGAGCDEQYTYFPLSPTTGTPKENRLMVYDWDCVFQGYVTIPLSAESEDMFVVGDRYYVNFAGSKASLYELVINPVYIYETD